MKKILTSSFLFLLPILLMAQTGKVIDNLTLESKILKMTKKYAIYLPPDYETSSRSYPVLYLLHGHGDDHTGWVQFGEVLHIADKAINEGKATPMIIVMPNGDTKYKGYINKITEDFRYEDFFFDEFMPYVEKEFRIKSEKRYRAISGLSMGGGGTFFYALHRSDLFSSACPLSAATGPLNLEDANRYLNWKNPEMHEFTDEQINKYYDKYSVLNMVEKMPDTLKTAVRWYIDCGDDDFLFEGNSLVHIAMRKNEIPHEFRIRNGAHNWTYWRESLPEVLKFVSDAFHQY